ncbi:hypothetical protein ISN45_Aa08g003900 [Arabidopsis thaliana x Arabidopsis arenosa]|uniref:Transmembrane protein n=1 Tax=Arabidopsis thaliana x Arabidopsis arenosa TaxID=1240361 RepID=A0A8T1XF63_9BRAS|nr:hypothetical protein ISN45_Aa08g003900 [Arabidopsis thaliana x Arabidopsis arenosa]
MRKKISSKFGQVLIVLLLLCTLLCRTESALPSGQQPFLEFETGRRIMSYYRQNEGPVRPSQSHQAGGSISDVDPPTD